MNDLDPAQQQEGAPEDANTVTDPQVTEEVAESPEKSEEGAPHEDQEEKDEQVPELTIVVDGEEPPPRTGNAPAWVKDLRKENRELKAKNAEIERALRSQAQPQVVDPGPKPTLESCDFDADSFEKKLVTWQEGQRRKESAEAQAAQQADANRRAWQTRLDSYAKSKDELSKQIPDFEDAETAVKGMLNMTQQGVLLHAADNAALVVAALGQNPNLAKDLASETDPIRFACKVAKLEARLKTQKKTPQVPPPEKPVNGSGSKSGADKTLEQLRAKADKTGDRTPVIEHLRKQRTAK